MDKTPLVTIITPAYNSEKYIDDTFKSVLKQTISNWEWLIIDDHSTDSTFKIISEYAESDIRIKVFQTPQNSGSAAARNIGLKNKQGRYVTFLDSDDFLDENYLESQLAFIKDNGPIITASYRRLASNTSTVFTPREKINYRDLLYGCDTSCLTTMFDSCVIENIYFKEEIKKDEDYIFWLKILEKGYVVKTNKAVLATYRITKTSKNGNKLKLFKPIYNIYRNELKFNFVRTLWHVFWYLIYGIKKYKNVR